MQSVCPHLRDLRMMRQSHVRSMKALGVDASSYGTMLSSVLLNKLSPELRLIVSRKVSTDKEMPIEYQLKLLRKNCLTSLQSQNVSISGMKESRKRTTLSYGS